MLKLINRNKQRLKRAIQASVAVLFFSTSSLSNAAVATAVGVGYTHSCAALASGGAKCWGSNVSGELGTTKPGSSATPVEVQGLSQYQIAAIEGGTYFTCALTSTGSVFCWGINNYGQLGTKTVASSNKPLQIQIPTGTAKAISVGTAHACALDTYGNIYCWGLNTSGQLNRNTSITKSEVPLYSAGMNDIVALQGYGVSTCYLDLNGGAKCFGNNKYGQLGLGTKDSTSGATYGAPKYVVGLATNVLSTSAGESYGCAVKTDSTVLCWGLNRNGDLGFEEYGTFLTPIVVQGLRNDARSVTTGFFHTCIITSSGGAQCWGANGSGQLGNGRALPQDVPSDVIGINEKIISLSLGYIHTCALLESGTVKCFGQGGSGQLGTGTTSYSPVPITVNL